MNFQLTHWLESFLARRGLKQPDHRPLFEYQVSIDEYEHLKSLVSSILAKQINFADKVFGACFTLFCAEWYRREYQKQFGWSWQPIWGVIGIELSPIELTKLVPKGLESYWNRPIRFYESERRNFLGSLFSEGGLPFQLLKEPGNKFQSVLYTIIKQHDQAKLLGYTTSDLVKLSVDKAKLPQVFNEDTSIELIASMAEQLFSLVHLYGLAGVTSPSNKLDEVNPSWRDSFPIPLEDETGTKILDSLLITATRETSKKLKNADSWLCQHIWSENLPNTLKTELSMPDKLKFKLIGNQPSTTYFELSVYEANDEVMSFGGGFAEIDNNIATVRTRTKRILVKRKEPASELFVVASSAGVVVGMMSVQNSVISIGDVPIGFEKHGDVWQLCGQASFSTKSTEVMLVVPNLSSVTSDENTVFIEGPKVLTLDSFFINNAAQVQVEAEDKFLVRVGDLNCQGANVSFNGELVEWSSQPPMTYLGMPKVNSHHSVAECDFKLYIKSESLDGLYYQEQMGTHYISVKNKNNETLIKRKLGILPKDFRVVLKQGELANQGSILIYTRHTCLFDFLNSDITTKKIKHDDHVEFRIATLGLPPANIQIRIIPNLQADPVVLTLPFPSGGFLAFDKEGKPFRKFICIDELLGGRLFLFGNPDATCKYELELSLKNHTLQHAVYRWSYTAYDKPVEISLHSIRQQVIDLLSLMSDIDKVVEMRIHGNGEDSTFLIRSYATDIEFDASRQLISFTDSTGSYDKLPEPEIMLINEPERKSSTLIARKSEGVPIGDYELPIVVQKNGPWLIIPKRNSNLTFRPLYLQGGMSISDESSVPKSLQKASLIYSPNATINPFNKVLDAMAEDPNHSGWQFLRSLYDNYGHLPLATFAVWKSLFNHPHALLMAMFKFEMSSDFVSRFESEFPLFWEFMPLYLVQKSGETYIGSLRDKGIPEEVLGNIKMSLYNRLGEVFPSYSGNIVNWLMDQQPSQEIQLPEVIVKGFIKGDWYQKLIRTNKDRVWPEFEGKHLYNWYLQHQVSVLDFEPELAYRHAVFYLPIFAADVASGKAEMKDVYPETPETVFFLRQIRDFDSQWFNALYQYSLLKNITIKNR
ncbi:MAG: STY4851/ECs_5259 family protein [Gammaproteobacteria bacterium]|nr:STY4851/ECs_5259 family protein [Gammaproteobacteria bacterium]